MEHFQVGQIVRDNASGKLWEVVSTTCNGRVMQRRKNVDSGEVRWCDERVGDYTLARADDQQNAKGNIMKLYQIKDTDTFVSRLATNSEGLAVVEEKGTGKVSAINPDLLIEVVPFTIETKDVKGNVRHFSANKDFWEVNDVFPFEGNLYVVSKIGSNGGDNLKKVPNKKLALVVG